MSRFLCVDNKKMFRNFCLHLVNLFEFGVIGPGHVFTAISRLQVCNEKSLQSVYSFLPRPL